MNAPAWDPPVAPVDMRAALLEMHEPLEAIARDVLGCGGRVGWVVRDPTGRVGLVQYAEAGRELVAWAELVAQLAWLGPRLMDWHQLAPERRIDPSLSPRALLVADAFDEQTRVAAHESASRVELWRLVTTRTGASLVPEGPTAATSAPPIAAFPTEGPGRRSRFRSRLRDQDL